MRLPWGSEEPTGRVACGARNDRGAVSGTGGHQRRLAVQGFSMQNDGCDGCSIGCA